MNDEISDRFKYDPSDIRQAFPDINIRLHCCRYWMLMEWECTNLASPFWRLYYNTKGKASVVYKEVTTYLKSDQILIIPPNTPFSSKLKGDSKNDIKERHVRKKILSLADISDISNSQASDHMFIHFNLGIPYDLLEPGIYPFTVTNKEKELTDEIKDFCINGGNAFDFTVCAAINELILGLLKGIPRNKWETPKTDKRVSNAIAYIENHLDERLTNKNLSDKAIMVENSFARLFRENIGISIQQYIKKKRIDKALILLHHSNSSIEEIAIQCGFSDRHHFSKVFKELMGMSPVSYKKQLIF
jgi:AraC-like DNA-binding protein